MIGRIWAFWSSKEKMWKFQEMCWNVIWWHMKRYELIQIVLMLFFILTCLCLFKETHGTCWDEHQGILLRSPTTWPGEDDSRSKVWGFFLAVLGKKERLTVKGFKKKLGGERKVQPEDVEIIGIFLAKIWREEPMIILLLEWMCSIHVTNTNIVKDLATT